MSDKAPTSYAEMAAIITQLPVALQTARRMRGLSLRAAGREIGVSFSTISRIEDGLDMDSGSLKAVLSWLDDQTRNGNRATP